MFVIIILATRTLEQRVEEVFAMIASTPSRFDLNFEIAVMRPRRISRFSGPASALGEFSTYPPGRRRRHMVIQCTCVTVAASDGRAT